MLIVNAKVKKYVKFLETMKPEKLELTQYN